MEPAKQLPETRQNDDVSEHEALLANVTVDAQLEPQRFLDDSRVPEGGE